MTGVLASPMLSDVIGEALRDDRDVELVLDGGYWAIAIDGEILCTGLPSESFDYPIDRISLDADQTTLASDLLEQRRRRVRRRREDRLETARHVAAEGISA